jgi:3',5'-cyclic AMP phosphodiesterase CpdA
MVRGVNPFARAQATVNAINKLTTPPDFIVHLGDIVADPDPDSYALAKELFESLNYPLYPIAGNHDDPAEVRSHIPFPKGTVAPLDDRSDFAFSLAGTTFIGLDASDLSFEGPHGLLRESSLSFFRETVQSTTDSIIVFLHFPPLPVECAWMDDKMLITNGENFHQELQSLDERLRGVFFGHVHRSMQNIRDRVPYFAMGATSCQFNAGLTEDTPAFYSDFLPTFYDILADPRQLFVKQYWPGTPNT